jgi:biopolymer transport protein ExbD
MKLRRVRQPRRGRIEIIPMIDVMFFLLATFMLASLSMQNLHSLPVDLPKGTADKAQSVAPATMTVTRENQIYLNKTPVTLANLTDTLQALLRRQHQTSVIVAADESSKEGVVVQAMLAARRAGVEHFLIAVQPK